MDDRREEPINVLLVDDRRENLAALTAILEKLPYRLLTATSGDQALKIALHEKLTAVLLDVVMPAMDGFEVARLLKQRESTRLVPILFLTAAATEVAEIYRAYDVGAVDYLVKPLDPDVVRKKVAVFVDLVRQREEIERRAAREREIERREFALKLAEMRVATDRRYRKLVEGIEQAIAWTADQNLRLTFVSAQAPLILGLSIEQFMLPDFWTQHLHGDDRDAVLATFRAALQGGPSSDTSCSHRLVGADGRVHWFQTAVSREDSEIGGTELHGISMSVTELKSAEEAARHATRAREEILAIVSHDLRSPLGVIVTGAEAVALTPADAHADRCPKYARSILRAAGRMNRLIGDLLEVSLLESGRLQIEIHESVSARRLVKEAVDAVTPPANEKGVRLATEVIDLALRCDEARVLQILTNLLGNAVKFTPSGGSVALRVEKHDERALFSVKDTGPGIAAEDIAKIWDRYWRAGKDRAGVGLGLAIAKALVEAHGGRIWVESAPGKGACFFVTLPLGSGAPPDRTGDSLPP
jgi:PAS domain S-box-containing protein